MSAQAAPCEVPLEFLVRVAKAAGAILAEGAGRRHRSETKRATTDLVTEYDRRAEAQIVDEIRRAYPDHSILAEESGARGPASPYRWLIDPLDGTTNFAHGLPLFCVSIGLEYRGVIVRGVVEAPVLNWTFAAERGKGATLNGEKIAVSDTETLPTALLATGFPYDRATHPQNNFAEFIALKRRAQGVRRLGSAALDLSLVACGRLDGYWERRLQPWDLAAGSLLVEEAGGRVTDTHGAPFVVDDCQALATNGRIHDAVLAALAVASSE